jgi:hypothetical protein
MRSEYEIPKTDVAGRRLARHPLTRLPIRDRGKTLVMIDFRSVFRMSK